MGERSLQAARGYLVFAHYGRLDAELRSAEFIRACSAVPPLRPHENNPDILLLGEAFGLFVLFEYPNFNSKK